MEIKINKTPEGILSYPCHSHRQYEVMYYTRGEGVMRTEDGDIPFSEGTVIIIPPKLSHGSFSERGFENISIEYGFEGRFAFDSPVVIQGSLDDDGAKLALMIFENKCGSEEYLSTLCRAYSQYLADRCDVKSAVSEQVRKIAEKIAADAFNPETDVSAHLRKSGYAEDYIRMRFRREMGKTPIAFLTELRIKHACYLIDIYKNTLSLSEIAERCGYFDYVYFSKRFKEYVGLSPREYMKG